MPGGQWQAGCSGWGIRTRLDGLLADGFIDREGHDAAARFRRDYEAAAGRVLRSPLAGIEVGLGPRGDGGDRERGMFARLAAARRLRQAQARLGKTAWLLLIACVVEGSSGHRWRGRSA